MALRFRIFIALAFLFAVGPLLAPQDSPQAPSKVFQAVDTEREPARKTDFGREVVGPVQRR